MSLTKKGSIWVLEQEISSQSVGLDNLRPPNNFGDRVFLEKDYLVIGSYVNGGSSSINAGSVYIFKRDDSSWRLQLEISDQTKGFNDLQPEDMFGKSIALSGDYLTVGAPYDDGPSSVNTGAVYIF